MPRTTSKKSTKKNNNTTAQKKPAKKAAVSKTGKTMKAAVTKTKKNTKTTSTKKITRKTFPKKELNNFLSTHTFWDHNEWNSLLNHLREKGYTAWADSQSGQNEIGMYLETNRSQ